MTDLQVTQKAPSLASKGDFAKDPIHRPYVLDIHYEIDAPPEDERLSSKAMGFPDKIENSWGLDYQVWISDHLREELNYFLNKQHDYCSLHTEVTPMWLGNDGKHYSYEEFTSQAVFTGNLFAEPETYVATYASHKAGGDVGQREFTTFSAKLALENAWEKIDDDSVFVSQLEKIGVVDPVWNEGDDEAGLEVL